MIFGGRGSIRAERYEANQSIKVFNTRCLEAGIQNVCKILRETDITQIQGHLIEFDGDVLVGKCAMGVVACESGLKLSKEHPNEEFSDILIAAGIPEEYVKMSYPYSPWEGYVPSEGHTMSGIIISMNDTLELPFDEMEDYLETTFIPEEI